MGTIAEIEKEIVDEFAVFDDWMDKYAYLIEIGSGLEGKVRIVATGCMGLCAQGPLVRVEIKGQKDVLYKRLEPLVARIIISEHVIPALKLTEGETFELPEFLNKYVLSLDLPFFTKQEKVVLKQAGHLDPEDIHVMRYNESEEDFDARLDSYEEGD